MTTTATRPISPRPSSCATKLFSDYEPAPLPPRRLLQILRSLPESDQLGFAFALDTAIAAPLQLDKLAAIWRSLKEEERFDFFLALNEPIAFKLLEATMLPIPEREAGFGSVYMCEKGALR